MKIIVGLGNPGKDYQKTRHNAGQLVVDEIGKLDGFVLLKTEETYMNQSGSFVNSVLKEYDLAPGDLVVIHDDWSFEIGEFRVQKDRGANGHNGVQNIIDRLGTKDFWRVRVGIGNPDTEDSSDYVLGKMSNRDIMGVKEITPLIIEKLRSLPA